MSSLFPRQVLSTLFLLIGLYISLPSQYALAQEVPSRAAVQQALNSLGASDILTASQQADQTFLVETLSLIDSIEQEKTKLEGYTERAREQPSELKVIGTQFEALTPQKSPEQIKLEYASMDMDALTHHQSVLIVSLHQVQEALEIINSQIANLQVLPDRTQTSMSQTYLRGEEIQDRLNASDISNAEALKLNTELALLDMRIVGLQKRLDNRTRMRDVALEQQRYQQALLSTQEQELTLLQEHINVRHLSEIKLTLDKPEMLIIDHRHPLVHQAQKTNHQLSQQLVNAMSSLSNLAQKNVQAKGWLKHSTQTERNLNEQVQVLKGNLLLSRLLYKRYQQLEVTPSIFEKNLDEQIADLHLTQFELSQQREQLSQKSQYLDTIIMASRRPINKEDKLTLSALFDTRISLLEQINSQLDNQLANAISLQLTQQQLGRVNASIKFTLQQHIFWVSSNKSIDGSWFLRWPAHADKQVTDWIFKFSWQGGREMILPISLLLLGSLLLWMRPAILKRQQCIANDLGRFRRDSQWHTPRALFYCVLLKLPGCLLILASGFWLTHYIVSKELIVQTTLNLALGYLVFSIYLSVMHPSGIGYTHFRIPKTALRDRHTCMRSLWLPLLSLIILSTKIVEPSYLGNDVVGQALTLLLLGITAVLIIFISRSSDKSERKLKALIMFTAVIPVVQIALIIQGYYYTALKLTNLLIGFFYLIIVWSLVYCTALRGLELAARRLAYKRMIAKREHKAQEESGCNDAIEEPLMDLREVSQQALRLTRTVLLLMLCVAFYGLWPDLVAIFSYLDNIVLWYKSDNSGTSSILYPISMRDVLIALVILTATWSLTRNLPGLLEVMVLSKLRLAQGTAYAFTTILNYLLIGGGTLTALSLMGMQWDKLQWLAAGLMVGIGFGLQEIVGNFVSGIIILFERPVRIGDTVTIGTFSGTVSKIRIRATTITDFDRKEVIIPNKALMTERLTNWSLTDTVTRVIVRVGVAYGSDLTLTRRLLMQAAEENSRVLKDPSPLIYFLAFSSSTLEHELRVFVSDIIDRNPAIDELNRRIDELFRENDIVIAFNQIDVHIKDTGTLEPRLQPEPPR